jgi:hypothetical protein
LSDIFGEYLTYAEAFNKVRAQRSDYMVYGCREGEILGGTEEGEFGDEMEL